MFRTLVHAKDLPAATRGRIESVIAGRWQKVADHYELRHEQPVSCTELDFLRHSLMLDLNPIPQDFRSSAVKLLVTDMDSTLITVECIDELAERIGHRDAVASITTAAMQGEIDFATALQQRVALLEGLPLAVLEEVYEERVRPQPGAEALLAACRRRGIRTAVVSGGFDFFAERVRERLGLDFARANRLEVEAGRLTGRIQGPIFAAQGKADFLGELCAKLGLPPQGCMALGDGANDARMLAAAGLGIGYRPKPALRSVADAVIEYSDLTAVVDFLECAP
ncbi:MAG TPA: phosphoserine phosphatase SerB [Methylococcus sp.]|nr:phosphoserine phosphatase SerB [Methylococcus sp.]